MTDLHDPVDSSTSPHFEDVVRERMSRRGALKAMMVIGGGAAGAALSSGSAAAAGPYAAGELTFDSIALNTNDQVTQAVGFKHDIVISWGDPVVPGAPAFDIANQTAAAQAQQFGFNNDYVDFKPLPKGSYSSDHGLLWVNHEYTSANMMFPGVTATFPNPTGPATTAEQKRIEIEAHGASIVEVSLNTGTGVWSYNPNSPYNRRITGSTPMLISGPCAGNVHLKTNADPTGTQVKGMLNNCGGGYTPWGTILTAEENFDQYFSNRTGWTPTTPDQTYAQANASVFGIPSGNSGRGWETVDSRFDMRVEWNEPFRFGWIVEVDPYDVNSTPKKRTALGRFKHEAAEGTTATNGKYVVYMGDDQAGQFIYKFVSSATVNTSNPSANADLLDSGTLYVAKYNSDGTGAWMPLVFGSGPLTAPTYEDQADVLIRCRTAGIALGATPMDRPEDVEVSPTTGYIYAAMTGTSRTLANVNAANPRISSAATDPNSSRAGHIIEMREDNNDHTGLTFTWEIFMLCGQPNIGGTLDTPTQPAAANSSGRTYFAGFDETQVSPIFRPDNITFDSLGNLWITTDGMPSAAGGGGNGQNDTIYGVPTAGAERGHLKALLSGPPGAEMTGPYFTDDDKTLFAAIQHPGEDGNMIQATVQSFWNSIPVASPPGACSRNAVIAIRRIDNSSIPAGTVLPPVEIPEFGLPIAAVATAAAVGGAVLFRQNRMNKAADAAG
jgi:uncharacterized protein